MKILLSSALVFGLALATAHAQSTMPAMGANTPKGEVAKTDASLNQTAAGRRTNTNSKSKDMTGKRMGKTKVKSPKVTNTL